MIDSPPRDCVDRLVRPAGRTTNARSLVRLALVAALVFSAAVAAPAGLVAAQSDDDPFELQTESVSSTADVTIRGTTTLDSGTELQVRLQSSGETSPQFLKTSAATVGSDGTWNATFDFSEVETHDSVSISVVATDGDQSADFEVPIRNDQSTPTESGSGSGSGTFAPGFGVAVAVAGVVGSALVFRGRR